jgi:hypothetical protein
MILSELFRAKRTLYVFRPLLNHQEIDTWAAGQGFTSTVHDMHVTIAFSKQPVEWDKFTPQRNRLTIHGGERHVEALGDKGAVVLSFPAGRLQRRWQEFCDGGASWDFPAYHCHVTVTYQGKQVDLSQVEPYQGDLIFGPEKFAVVDEDWNDKIVERPVRIAF